MIIILLNIKSNQKKYYSDINSFVQDCEINEIDIKTLWKDVTNTDFLQDTKW